jgi:DNA invertase Pin-like site-specific DNA recombinase
MKVDAYIRVSSTKGRDAGSESFITTDEQARAIKAYAASHGLDLAEWHTDLDQSGGTLERPAFQAALTRCRNGETGGIIAAKLDRIARSTIGLGTLIEEARAGGWNLIAADFGLDLFSSNGELVANVLGSVAQWERKRRGEDWTTARRNSLDRGIPNGRVPFGYRKRKDGRPEIVENRAAKVREAFDLRGRGVPFSQIARRFRWSHSTARQILCNEAYIGTARSGAFVNESAYPPIISREAFAAAQAARTTQPVPTKGLLLVGLARCGGCGRTLKAVRRPRVDGTYAVSDYCKNAASEPCPDRAFVHAVDLDPFVAAWFESALENVPRMVDVVSAGRELEAAQTEQSRSEAELNAYIENASALDARLFQRGLAARQEAVDRAVEKVRHLSARLTRIPAGGTLTAPWSGFSALERREVLGGFLDRVEVDRGASRRPRRKGPHHLVGRVDRRRRSRRPGSGEVKPRQRPVRLARGPRTGSRRPQLPLAVGVLSASVRAVAGIGT